MIMAKTTYERPVWPNKLGPRDDLYAVVDIDNDSTEYLVFASSEKGATYVRNNGAWFQIDENFFDDIDDPKYATEFVDVEYITYYDRQQLRDEDAAFYSVDIDSVDESPIEIGVSAPVMAAAESDKCPVATQNVSVNLKNRRRAIRDADYGPMNPAEENTDYWVNIADLWGVSAAEAKKSTCGNCVFFFVTTKIRDCIASGLSSDSTVNDPWDSIDAGDLGYCEAFDFKCAGSRTCSAWATGGPITDENLKEKGVER